MNIWYTFTLLWSVSSLCAGTVPASSLSPESQRLVLYRIQCFGSRRFSPNQFDEWTKLYVLFFVLKTKLRDLKKRLSDHCKLVSSYHLHTEEWTIHTCMSMNVHKVSDSCVTTIRSKTTWSSPSGSLNQYFSTLLSNTIWYPDF